MPIVVALVAAGAFAVSLALTLQVRRLALHRGLLDEPTARSSHVVATPRGGGVAIAVALAAGVAVLLALGRLDGRLAAGLAGGIPVAWIGWRDDHGGVRPTARALVHALAAGWAMAWLGTFTEVRLGGRGVPLGWAGAPLTILFIVWMVNLYNFMDGIDGLAAGEAVTVGVAGALLLGLAGRPALASAAWLVAAACAGFLVWNWAPARIFLGDIGSGLLGYWFAVLALRSDGAGAVPVVIWVLLLGTFAFDATVTLVRRLLRREAVASPHRSHAYQRAAHAGLGHAAVTGAMLGLNVVLAGLAVLSVRRPSLTAPALAAATILLAVTYLVVEARRPMGAADGPAGLDRARAP